MFRERADGVAISWNRDLTLAERTARIEAVYHPYHREVDRMLGAARLRGARPLVLAVHSFTDRYEGRARRFDIGVLYDRSPAEARVLARRFREAGLRVRYNEPYSGKHGLMYSAERHAAAHELPCLELECNQALFSGADAPAVAARIGKTVADAVREIVGG